MESKNSLIEELAMAAGVEDLVRKRGSHTLLGWDRRLWLLALLGVGVGITTVASIYSDLKAKGQEYSKEYPKLAA